ncbi:site-specific integrase [Amycolatopsis alkalitolerans]|uniref:Site-specific integrase n=2 Tax=Amycolatopsis alkalitolerans TaxID=2547244 RepID=A0A5C4M3X7_9PSEU|nr:site-specific integrase [Amycolatopsis alkalitolerans]
MFLLSALIGEAGQQELSVTRFRKFAVRLPSGVRYWTVLDPAARTVAEADEWLLHLRLGRDCAESTTEAYATSLALFFQWCQVIEVNWPEAAGQLARFTLWLRHYDPDAVAVPARRVVRGDRRINAVLAAVREFFRHSVSIGLLDNRVLATLYDLSADRRPLEVRGEWAGTGVRCRPRHRLRASEQTVDAAGDEEVLALVRACRNARDRFIVLALWRMGLRRGELAGARVADVHFLPDSSSLGCPVTGPHLHVRRRDNINGAWAKSRRARMVPADGLVVRAFDEYLLLRQECRPARDCDFLLVNVFREPRGGPMRPQALNELLDALSRRAGLSRMIHPHMLRHGFGTNVMASGSTLDVLKELLGHRYITSTEVYLHPSDDRLREAVDRAGSPRTMARR